MSKVLTRTWRSDIASGLPRRDRASCDYEAYVPDPLLGRPIILTGESAADVADAEAAINRFDATASALADTEALTQLLLRAGSVASSRIEGLEVGGRRLARAEAAEAIGEEANDVTAVEVLGNIRAMSWAIDAIGENGDITLEVVLEAHRRLMIGTPLETLGGHVREEQNWIGGSSYNPCRAVFVPAPPEYVSDLLDDLIAFCNDDALPPVVQAALAHAQFETIHPFVDGNGRIGRALIQLVLRRRGLCTRVVPPVSLILATWSQDYVAGLIASRYRGRATSRDATEGLNHWVALFATACRRAVADAQSFEAEIINLQAQWRSRLSSVRRGSTTDLQVDALPGAPVLTVAAAAELTGRSFEATNQAIARLAHAGIVQQVRVGRRNRAFEVPEVLRRFTDLERRLPSPAGDTRSSEPSRRVPRPPAGDT